MYRTRDFDSPFLIKYNAKSPGNVGTTNFEIPIKGTEEGLTLYDFKI